MVRELLSTMAVMEAKVRNAFIRSISKVISDPELTSLINDIQQGKYTAFSPDVEGRIANVSIDTQEVVKYTRQAMAKAGGVTAKRVGLDISFDITNPRAIDYARTLGADMVRYVNNSARDNIRKIVGDLIEGAITPQQARRMIKQNVGLLPKHAVAVSNYEQNLLTAGKTPTQVVKMVDQYANRLLKYRADMIARTETARAMSVGQTEYWQQSMDAGLLPPDTQRVWIAEPNYGNICKVCESFNGTTAPLNGGWWIGTNKYVEYPTDSHPNCRCATGLVFPTLLNKADPIGYELWLMEKGDYPGHPFRGNQWTGGIPDPSSKAGQRRSKMVLAPISLVASAIREESDAILSRSDDDYLLQASALKNSIATAVSKSLLEAVDAKAIEAAYHDLKGQEIRGWQDFRATRLEVDTWQVTQSVAFELASITSDHLLGSTTTEEAQWIANIFTSLGQRPPVVNAYIEIDERAPFYAEGPMSYDAATGQFYVVYRQSGTAANNYEMGEPFRVYPFDKNQPGPHSQIADEVREKIARGLGHALATENVEGLDITELAEAIGAERGKTFGISSAMTTTSYGVIPTLTLKTLEGAASSRTAQAEAAGRAWEQTRDKSLGGVVTTEHMAYDLAANVVKSWAVSSASSISRMSMDALQQVLASRGRDDISPSSYASDDQNYGPGYSDLTPVTQRVMQATVASMYDNTQATLKRVLNGATHVILSRGMMDRKFVLQDRLEDEGVAVGRLGQTVTTVEIPITGRTLQAWAYRVDVAQNFARGQQTETNDGIVLLQYVPVENVFGTALSGMGCWDEAEFVVIGTKNDKAFIVRTEDAENMQFELQEMAGGTALGTELIVVDKGDYPGHPFRGNQWTGGIPDPNSASAQRRRASEERAVALSNAKVTKAIQAQAHKIVTKSKVKGYAPALKDNIAASVAPVLVRKYSAEELATALAEMEEFDGFERWKSGGAGVSNVEVIVDTADVETLIGGVLDAARRADSNHDASVWLGDVEELLSEAVGQVSSAGYDWKIITDDGNPRIEVTTTDWAKNKTTVTLLDGSELSNDIVYRIQRIIEDDVSYAFTGGLSTPSESSVFGSLLHRSGEAAGLTFRVERTESGEARVVVDADYNPLAGKENWNNSVTEAFPAEDKPEQLAYDIVANLVRGWAISSAGEMSRATMEALVDELGRRGVKGLLGSSFSTLDTVEGKTYAELSSKTQKIMQDVAGRLYDDTQKALKKALKGATHVLLFRGMQVPELAKRLKDEGVERDGILRVSGEVPLSGRVLQAWAYDPEMAIDFARTGGDYIRNAVVVARSVPIENVFGTALSGLGCWDESEMVVIGTQNDRGVVIHSDTPPERITNHMMEELSISKGDYPGHPFRGNQWTGGIPDPSKTLSGGAVGEEYEKAIPESFRAAIDRRMKKLGITVDMINAELERAWQEVDPSHVKDSEEWYGRINGSSRQLADELNAKYGTDIGFEEVAAVVAALSPAREFVKNARDARILVDTLLADEEFKISMSDVRGLKVDGKKVMEIEQRLLNLGRNPRPSDFSDDELAILVPLHPAFSKMKNTTGFTNVVIAAGIVRRTAPIDELLGGPKVRSFYNNIVDPEGIDVTVDTWMYRVMTPPDHKFTYRNHVDTLAGHAKRYREEMGKPMKVQDIFQKSPTQKDSGIPDGTGLYPLYAALVREFAKGKGISPAAAQAILWEVARTRAGEVPTVWEDVAEAFAL